MRIELPPPPTTHHTSRLVRLVELPLPTCKSCGEDIAEKYGMGSNLCRRCERAQV